ncbi:hypothetical protein GCM10009801_68360 [Streptomyces albiaxialis]|uniref:PD(D/E)XK endonuclease domain-containing protein n=2 Tax=Streptomyces albiaxialis TaxID=329523 RepID=A0ABP5IBU0_9ACTN
MTAGATTAYAGGGAEREARKATVCEEFREAYARCSSPKKGRTQASYHDKGDKVDIVDRYRNGRSTKVMLQVKGSGIAVFSSRGEERRIIPNNYTDGKKVRLKVCTSFSSKAKCSDWSGWGTT